MLRLAEMAESYSAENLQVVVPLSSVPELLRRFAMDPAEVLAAAGLSAKALDDPEATIPYRAVGLLLDIAAEKTGCPHFGLEAGQQIRTTSLGLVGELMLNAPTVGVAMLDFVDNQHRNAHGSVAYLLTEEHRAFFGYAVYEPNIRGYQSICDWVAMAGFTVVCELVGASHKHAIEVLFSRSEPADLAFYHQAFGVKLRFNSEQTALLVPKGWLDHPVIGANPRLRKVLEKRVAALWHAGGLDTVTHLRRALRVGLLSGQVNADEICARVGMSRRTLHRRLAAWGLRFQEVLDETRHEFAQQLLVHTRLGIGEIALIVGYADPSIFTRAFVRWTGSAPSDWRSKANSGRISACAATAARTE